MLVADRGGGVAGWAASGRTAPVDRTTDPPELGADPALFQLRGSGEAVPGTGDDPFAGAGAFLDLVHQRLLAV